MKVLLLLLPVLCLAENTKEPMPMPLKPNTSIFFNDTGMLGAELEDGHKVLSSDSGEFEFWVSDYTDKGKEKKLDNYTVEFKFSNTYGKTLSGFKSFNNKDLKHITFVSSGDSYFEFEQNIILDPVSGEYKNNDKKPWVITSNIFTLNNASNMLTLNDTSNILKSNNNSEMKNGIYEDELKSFIQNNLAFKSEESNEMYKLTLELGNFMGINNNKSGDSDWTTCLADLGIVGGAALACYACTQVSWDCNCSLWVLPCRPCSYSRCSYRS